MNDFDRFLIPLREAPDAGNIAHMVVGSTAVSWLATPRVTNDVDIVVDTTKAQMLGLVRQLSSRGFYFDELSAIDAVERKSMVNAIDPESGWKADLIVLDEEPFHREEFARRKPIQTPAGMFSVQTVEDLILSKLRWGKESASEKQFRDVVGVFDVWRPEIDRDYLLKWAAAIGVADLLSKLFERPE